MPCLNPITVRPKGLPMSVDCGNCIECMRLKRHYWSTRLSKETRYSDSAFFVTFTYTNENLRYGSEGAVLHYPDFQKFMKRLRKIDKSRIKYFVVGEYSESGRPHYHALIFNAKKLIMDRIEDVWKLGRCHVGKVNEKTINYTLKYLITKDEANEKEIKPFMRTSKAMGYEYAVRTKYSIINRGFVIENGKKSPIPKYYSKKIMTAHTRAKIGKQKYNQVLDKEKEHLQQLEESGIKDPNAYLQEIKNKKVAKYAEVIRKGRKL